ncbi:MAG: DUF4271 domain-containing protein [Bacteroidota bacterium]
MRYLQRIMIRLFFISFLLSVSVQLGAQPYRVLVRNLADEWMVQHDGQWKSASVVESYETVYLSLDGNSNRGTYLEVIGVTPFSVWCNGKLVGRYAKQSSLSLDSLATGYSSQLKFAIVAPTSAPYLQTNLVKFSPEPVVEELRLRTSSFFLNFSTLATLLLCIYFVILYRSNPRLILDYFNFAKLFSIQERDENLTAGRITSSINLVMYVFICLWFSLLLLVVFHFTPQHWVVSRVFSFNTEWLGAWTWLKLSVLMLAAFFAKMALLFISTQVFKFREGYATQALNFFRMLVFSCVLLTIVITIYFIARVDASHFYYRLITYFGWLLAGWTLLLFLKLMTKAPFSSFHLFFYLCASEIFPLVIFFQILFF